MLDASDQKPTGKSSIRRYRRKNGSRPPGGSSELYTKRRRDVGCPASCGAWWSMSCWYLPFVLFSSRFLRWSCDGGEEKSRPLCFTQQVRSGGNPAVTELLPVRLLSPSACQRDSSGLSASMLALAGLRVPAAGLPDNISFSISFTPRAFLVLTTLSPKGTLCYVRLVSPRGVDVAVNSVD